VVPQARWGDALLPFQRAQAIRAAFFGDGGRQFGVRMDLRLLELDPGIGQLTIDVDGQAVRFARDTRGVQTLQWPGPGGRVQLQTRHGTVPYSANKSSPRAGLRPHPRGNQRPPGDPVLPGQPARVRYRSAHPGAQRRD